VRVDKCEPRPGPWSSAGLGPASCKLDSGESSLKVQPGPGFWPTSGHGCSVADLRRSPSAPCRVFWFATFGAGWNQARLPSPRLLRLAAGDRQAKACPRGNNGPASSTAHNWRDDPADRSHTRRYLMLQFRAAELRRAFAHDSQRDRKCRSVRLQGTIPKELFECRSAGARASYAWRRSGSAVTPRKKPRSWTRSPRSVWCTRTCP
jgi:hypothetical protein